MREAPNGLKLRGVQKFGSSDITLVKSIQAQISGYFLFLPVYVRKVSTPSSYPLKYPHKLPHKLKSISLHLNLSFYFFLDKTTFVEYFLYICRHLTSASVTNATDISSMTLEMIQTKKKIILIGG